MHMQAGNTHQLLFTEPSTALRSCFAVNACDRVVQILYRWAYECLQLSIIHVGPWPGRAAQLSQLYLLSLFTVLSERAALYQVHACKAAVGPAT